MLIKHIITESWPGTTGVKSISHEEVIKNIAAGKSNPMINAILNAFQPGKAIYRGFRSNLGSDMVYIDPATAEDRLSANTLNYYTWWIDYMSNKWTKYPKRSRSFICSTNDGTSGYFGNTYLLVPTKSTTIGVCPANDFWNSFKSDLEPDEFNQKIEKLLQANNSRNIDSLTKFKKAIVLFDKNLLTSKALRAKFIKYMTGYFDHTILNNANLTSLMDLQYDPKRNGFTTMNWPKDSLPKN
jgi:hypothetical protein